MPVLEPYPSLDEILRLTGEAGTRLMEIGASEGAAGNISVYIGWPVELRHRFPLIADYPLPIAVPELANHVFLVTGSGRRLGEIGGDPEANLCAIRINGDGTTGALHKSQKCLFERPTSEFNSHLAVHREFIPKENLNFHAVIHAQPPHLTFLSQIPDYQDSERLSRKILRWQPETLVNLPLGVAYLPFMLPGSNKLMDATVAAMRTGHRVVLWAKHGVMARSDQSVKRAADRIEYAETAARYEYFDLSTGQRGQGLTDEELHGVATAFGVKQNYF